MDNHPHGTAKSARKEVTSVDRIRDSHPHPLLWCDRPRFHNLSSYNYFKPHGTIVVSFIADGGLQKSDITPKDGELKNWLSQLICTTYMYSTNGSF